MLHWNATALPGRRLALAAQIIALSAFMSNASGAAKPGESGVPRQAAAVAADAATKKPAAPGTRWERTVREIASGKWTGPRLPDGQPDIQGDWSNTIANQNNWTDPQGGIPGDPTASNHHLGPRPERAPSRVRDPASGELPFQPWARARQAEILPQLFNPT